MAADPDAHQFSWSEFMVYVEVTFILFEHYQFLAVLEHDTAWHKWRRAHALPWSSTNPILRDIHLTGKSLSRSNPKPHPSLPNPIPMLCLF
jgi:hypothetical protein